jgi:transcription antitermination factor NusG
MSPQDARWFALQVVPRHEKKVADTLNYMGHQQFFPTYRSRRRWSDRTKTVELPLFSGYVFCRTEWHAIGPIRRIIGVNRIVGFGGKACPILDEEITALQKIGNSGFPVTSVSYITLGQRVQIIDGPLAGIRGLVTRVGKKQRVIISVDAIMKSISIDIETCALEPIPVSSSRQGRS